MQASIDKINALIDCWFDIMSEKPIDDSEEFLQRQRLIDCALRLGHTLREEADAPRAESLTKEMTRLLLDVRVIVREATDLAYQALPGTLSEKRAEAFSILLPSAINFTLNLAFEPNWDYRNKLVELTAFLLQAEKLKVACSLTVVALDSVGRWTSSSEEYRERMILWILSSQLFSDLKPYLPNLDPTATSRWEYEKREFGVSSYTRRISEDGNVAVNRRPVDTYKVYSEECSVEIKSPPRRLDIPGWVHALRWLNNNIAWIVFDEKKPVFLDFKNWSFTPDERAFTQAECETRDLSNIGQWLKAPKARN